VAALVACNALTGVGDLDPSLGLDANPDGSAGGDGASADGANGGGDGSSSDAPLADVGPDTRSLVKAITFEDGVLVHPVTGVTTTLGDASLLGAVADAGADAADADPDAATLPDVITGKYSMYVASTAVATQTLPLVDEVFVTARFRVEQAVSTQTGIFRITSATAPNLDIVLQTSMSLTAAVGGTTLGTSAVIQPGKVYRLGVHVLRTMGNGNPNGAAEVYLANDGAAFASAFGAQTKIAIERSTNVTFGVLGTASPVTFDDITIDSAFLR